MEPPNLEFIDVGGLIRRLNRTLTDSEEPIELGDIVDRNPEKNPFLHQLQERELRGRGEYPLIQESYRGFWGILKVPRIIDLGHIWVERGHSRVKEREITIYEQLRLRILYSLIFKNGDRIPPCNIKLSVEYRDWEPHIRRVDHRIYFPLLTKHVRVSVRRSLESLLPTDWFLSEKAKPYWKI